MCLKRVLHNNSEYVPLCERDITPLLPRLTIVLGRDYAALLVFAGENDGTEPCGPGLWEH